MKIFFADDMQDARTFFLILKVGTAAGDSSAMAEHALYPIDVKVKGEPTTLLSAEDFERHYEGIVDGPLQQALKEAQELDLELQLDGIRAADGTLWFNQFCVDPACTQDEFLIKQINN